MPKYKEVKDIRKLTPEQLVYVVEALLSRLDTSVYLVEDAVYEEYHVSFGIPQALKGK